MDTKSILDLPMSRNDARATNIGEYLRALLATLWDEGESFSGKRPFGNSGWDYDLYKPLIVAGLVTGSLDEGGHINDCDERKAHDIIRVLLNDSILTHRSLPPLGETHD